MTTELPGSDRDKNLAAMREVIRDAIRARIGGGDKKISIVEGYTLLGPRDGCGFVDGVHPNDLGFEKMANGLEPHLRVILGLQ
jgi:lysophospholipase L1-like esterase